MRSRRSAAILSALALSFFVSALSTPSHAQTPDELKAARELFQEAYKDEQEKRYADALEKFQRVAKVKESASVRYRIASVQESMLKLRAARDSFRALGASKADLAPNEQEVAESAKQRAAAIDKRIPHLALRLADGAPPDAQVTVDGAVVPATTAPQSFELDPGEHVVRAEAKGAAPFESKVTLGEGGEVALTVPLQGSAPPPPPPPPETDARPAIAYVALAAGGALVVTSVVLLIVRANDISTLNEQCPNGICPANNRSALESTHDQATLFGPLGVGVGVAGLAAAGLGAYLLVRPSSSSSSSAALRVMPRVERSGVVLGLGSSF